MFRLDVQIKHTRTIKGPADMLVLPKTQAQVSAHTKEAALHSAPLPNAGCLMFRSLAQEYGFITQKQQRFAPANGCAHAVIYGPRVPPPSPLPRFAGEGGRCAASFLSAPRRAAPPAPAPARPPPPRRAHPAPYVDDCDRIAGIADWRGLLRGPYYPRNASQETKIADALAKGGSSSG
jgi:hypothetical protein